MLTETHLRLEISQKWFNGVYVEVRSKHPYLWVGENKMFWKIGLSFLLLIYFFLLQRRNIFIFLKIFYLKEDTFNRIFMEVWGFIYSQFLNTQQSMNLLRNKKVIPLLLIRCIKKYKRCTYIFIRCRRHNM